MADEWVFSPRCPLLRLPWHDSNWQLLSLRVYKLCRFYHCSFLGDSLKVILSQNMDLISLTSVVVEDRSKYKEIIM